MSKSHNSQNTGDNILRTLAVFMVSAVFLFLIDNTLIFWLDWPGIKNLLIHIGLLNEGKSFKPLADELVSRGWFQLITFTIIIVSVALWVKRTSGRALYIDGALYSKIAAFIVRSAFWAALLIGIADMFISFLRVEGFLPNIVGEHWATQLGRPVFRGSYVHFPLIILSIVIASISRSLGFIWLALMIVAAEFLIVITRFVFSYEQAFMADLVRFWYAGLFLFSSAYTLLHDGHVRVDVLYANFSPKGKALTNIFGSLLLGLPLCWNVLIQGMAGKGSVINSPLLSFEISQSGFGMFTKYLMAGYLIVFSVSMAVQFTGFILSNISAYRNNVGFADLTESTGQ